MTTLFKNSDFGTSLFFPQGEEGGEISFLICNKNSFAIEHDVRQRIANGEKVVTFDFDGKFKELATQLKGQYLNLVEGSDICLNPFSYIPETDTDNREFALEQLCAIFQNMIYPQLGAERLETACLQQAISESWKKYGYKADTDKVVDYLIAKDYRITWKLAQDLRDFSSQGSFGHFFNGREATEISSSFVVIGSDSNIAQRKLMNVARRVVLLAFMYSKPKITLLYRG